MVKELIINDFVRRIREDPRIGPSHISLFWALLIISFRSGQSGSIEFWKEEVVAYAKISFTTFYRCMHDLHEFGYVIYVPSFHAKVRSRVRFLMG